MFYEVNYLSVVAAAVAHFIVGALWYGLFFAKQWLAAQNFTEQQMEEAKKGAAFAFAGSFIGSLFLAWSVAVILKYLQPPGVLEGVLFGFLFWFGFTVFSSLNALLYEKRHLSLLFIDGSYNLAGIVAVSAVISVWV